MERRLIFIGLECFWEKKRKRRMHFERIIVGITPARQKCWKFTIFLEAWPKLCPRTKIPRGWNRTKIDQVDGG